jgi:hypothetical protein
MKRTKAELVPTAEVTENCVHRDHEESEEAKPRKNSDEVWREKEGEFLHDSV